MGFNDESGVIDKAKKGNEEAWSVLFKWNFKPVYSFCLQLVKGHDNEAEEITQQTFVIAARKVYKFNTDKGTFRLWLYGIAKNCYRKHLSKKKVVIYGSQNLAVDTPTEPTNAFSKNRLVLEVLARLPAHHSAILEAKYFHGKSLAQVAEDHQATVSAIESRLTRAREKFKQTYQVLLKQEQFFLLRFLFYLLNLVKHHLSQQILQNLVI